MKIAYPALVAAYVLPPLLVVYFSVNQGAISGVWMILLALFRSFLVAVVAGALTLGAANNRHLQHPNGDSRKLVLYVFYWLAFFVLGGLYGLELRFPDQHQLGRYTF